MTRLILARNVNHAFLDGLMHLRTEGITEKTRGGSCLVAPGPVITTYQKPTERLLFNPTRDCNHVFHLMETIWMFAGQRNVEWLLAYNSKFKQYAEPNGNQHGAYGHRWIRHFDRNQIFGAIDSLKANPHDRRVVIGMWDPKADMRAVVNDVPCNTHIYLDMRGGRLNMTVCNRSNDMLWGAYGANVVHMSMLMELIARSLGVGLGEYRQFSNNFHVYTNVAQVKHFLDNPPVADHDLYMAVDPVEVHPLLWVGEEPEDFLWECEQFVLDGDYQPASRFLRDIARPLQWAYLARKKHDSAWQSYVSSMPPMNDWRVAFEQWAERREPQKEQEA